MGNRTPRRQRGQATIEYVFLLMLVAMISFLAVVTLGKNVNSVFSNISNAIGPVSVYCTPPSGSGSLNVTAVTPTTITAGEQMRICGTGFGTQTGNYVEIVQGSNDFKSSNNCMTITNWQSNEIDLRAPDSQCANLVPGGAATTLTVNVSSVASNSTSLTPTNPVLSSVSPTSLEDNQSITVTGTNFGTLLGTSDYVEIDSPPTPGNYWQNGPGSGTAALSP